MIPENYLDIIVRLVLAVIFGGLIGYERLKTNHDAGLKTHILVCLGAAGVMVMSEQLSMEYTADAARIPAQVVSGIGFLGAGCIMVSGSRIKGLTTAAGLWTTACVGLCVGTGYYFLSVLMTALVLLVMLLLQPIATKLAKKNMEKNLHTVKVTLLDGDSVRSVTKRAAQLDLTVSSIEQMDTELTVKFHGDESDAKRFVLSLIESQHIVKAETIIKE